MKVIKNTRTVFAFPTGFIVNRFTAGILRRRLKKEGIKLKRKQVLLIIKEIKRYKKSHSGWNVIEVDNKSKDTVKIRI
jgi:hypothetical protein